MKSPDVQPPPSGVDKERRGAFATPRSESSTRKASSCVRTGRESLDAPRKAPVTTMSAPAAAIPLTERQSALSRRKLNAFTPLNPDAWQKLLKLYNLSNRYPHIPAGLRTGFRVGIAPIRITRTPRNSPSLIQFDAHFKSIISREFNSHRYLGPFTRSDVEQLIGPFQTSPLSLIPKPNKPNAMRLVQNFSYPRNPSVDYCSVNSHINSDDFPCTWTPFRAFCVIVWNLPAGSQGMVRDVSEAYRIVPLHHSQWAGTVVRLSEGDEFAIDTQTAFGISSGAGIYGYLGDGSSDIMRRRGIGPLTKWVDDFVFFRILLIFLNSYNAFRATRNVSVKKNGGRIHAGGRILFRGETWADGYTEELDEDFEIPIADLSKSSPRPAEEAKFSCNKSDIDEISQQLGIPWQAEKDTPWGQVITFTGFVWNLAEKTVSLASGKREKYLAAISEWEKSRAHPLKEVQKLFDQLLHASLIVPSGRAYLTSLESMLGLFHDQPFKPRTPPRSTAQDIHWWKNILLQPSLSRSIPGPTTIKDLAAFSDASSSVGIGIVIGGRWRAWRLAEGWKSEGRDIGWAEAVGFELLVRTILLLWQAPTPFKVFGDNQGVVEGWGNGRSRNQQVNSVFRRVHEVLETAGVPVLARYVPSIKNPADGPSRGIFPSASLLLPPIPLPSALQPFVIDCIHAQSNLLQSPAQGVTPLPKPQRCAGRTRASHYSLAEQRKAEDSFLREHLLCSE